MNKQFPTTEALDEQERELARVLRALPGVDAVNVVAKDGNGVIRLHVESARGRDVREQVFTAAVQNHWILLEMRRETVSFEDVFRELTAA